MSVRIEMRRAVRIRELLRRKGVRNKVIQPAHHQMIREILLHTDALFPAVVAEDLAHRTTLLQGVDGRHGSCELSERVMPEFTVSHGMQEVSLPFMLALRQDLSADIVDPCHVLPCESAEVVTKAGDGPKMLVAVLDQVTDVHHAVRSAPVTQLERKALLYKPSYRIHVVTANTCLQIGINILIKDQRKIFCIISSPSFLKPRAYAV